MSGKKVALAFAIGFAGGYLLQKAFVKPALSPEQALKMVKGKVKSAMTIDGAWIYQSTEEWKGNHVHQHVYRGGLTERSGEQLNHYDFVVDSETGALLTLTPQL